MLFLSNRNSRACSATTSFNALASCRRSLTSLLVAARAVSPASLRLLRQLDAGILLDERQHLALDELRIGPRHRVVFAPALGTLRVLPAIADLHRDMGGTRRCAIRLSSVVFMSFQAVEPPSPNTMNGASVPGTYCAGT